MPEASPERKNNTGACVCVLDSHDDLAKTIVARLGYLVPFFSKNSGRSVPRFFFSAFSACFSAQITQ